MNTIRPALRFAFFVIAGTALCAQTPDAAFQRGADLYRAGRCSDAIVQLRQSRGTPRANLMIGRCYFEARDYPHALESLQQYRQTVPGDLEAAILLARAQEGMGDFAKAVPSLEALRTAHPASQAVRDALAEAYGKTGKAAQGDALYREVLKEQPNDIGALMGLADLAVAASKWADAVDGYAKVLRLSPSNFTAEAGMGMALIRADRSPDAIPHLKNAARLHPDDWEISKSMAGCYEKINQWAEVIQALEFNSRTHAGDEKITAQMAQAFAKTGNKPAAEQYYRDILLLAPGNTTAHQYLGDLYYEAKRPDARQHYVAVLKAHPDQFDISDRLGQLSEQEKDLKTARDYYAAACKSPQATPAMKWRLASAYFNLNELDQARPALQAALQADPANREAKSMLFTLAVKTEQTEEAAKLAAELLPDDKNNPKFLRALAEGAAKNQRNAEAAGYLEQAILVDQDKALRQRLIELYINDESLNQQERALTLINDLVGLYPDDPAGYLLLGELYRNKNKKDLARQNYTLGFEKMPAQAPAHFSWAYTGYGLLLNSEKKFEDAATSFTTALGLNSEDSGAQYGLAMAYVNLKRKEDAVAAREKLSQMNVPELLAFLDTQLEKVFGIKKK